MRTLGDGQRLGARWVLLVLGALGPWLVSSCSARSPCDAAFDARAWDRVVRECDDPRWGGRERLGRAWIAWSQQHEDEALALAERLLGTNLDADAAYLIGYMLGQHDGGADRDLGRARLQQALHGYQNAGRHADASRAASALSRVPSPESPFSDRLEAAQIAVAEGTLSGDAVVLGRALSSRAEAYDAIGMEAEARDDFLHAEQLTEPWPAELAHIYFKHAAFLLDLATPHDLETSLEFFDAASRMRSRAIAIGLGQPVSELAVAIPLNRADALSQLGRLAAADRELVAADRELGTDPDADQLSAIRLVRGYVAARRDDPPMAEALFAQADDISRDADYRWRSALELARSYHRAGRIEPAERAYRTAITIIEKLRGATGVVELRPWVLSRRARSYEELLALLVEQDRGVDALVIAESLHARAWLDVVLGPGTNRATTTDAALAAARIRQRLGVASALDGASLMATVGGREALVFLTLDAATWRAHISQGSVVFRRLPADAVELVRRFRAEPSDPAASERAAAVLLPAELSTSGDPLYVIATGLLADVPFAALRWRGRYLIDHRPVARLPGLAALRCRSSTWDQRAIVLGDSHGSLPAAAREVREIAAVLGVSAGVGRAVSRAALVSAHGAGLLHIAAHDIMSSSGRAIVLADGNLTAADVLDAGVDPRVIVLSGCATAASNDAESWDGFPSAFLAAGSRYVVATLRSVGDDAAARVTAAYYAQPASLDPIERLAAAQRQVAGTLPVVDWASFAAWGSAACDDAPPCSIEPRGSSSDPNAIVRTVRGSVRPSTTVQGRDPGALPRGAGPLCRGRRRPQLGGAHP